MGVLRRPGNETRSLRVGPSHTELKNFEAAMDRLAKKQRIEALFLHHLRVDGNA
jgi:hypothetical protein